MIRTTARSILLLVTAACVALATSPVVAGEPVAATSSGSWGPPPTTIAWTACGEGADPAAQCGTVAVPLDYDRPRAGSVTIGLARIAASNANQKLGTVFVNPGGPGGSGVDFVAWYGFGSYLAELLGGRYDVVGFDPRGVGATEPIRCFESNDAAAEFLGSQPVFPFEQGQYRPFYEAWFDYGKRCGGSDQPIVTNMSTADVARDLDELRRAVGDRGLNYLGFSYGSYIGNTYAKLFSQNVGRMVIDGVLDPQLWSSGWQITSDRIATQEVLDEFLRLCDEAGADCAFHTAEGAASRWDRLAKSLRAQPVDLGDGFLVGYDLLVAVTTSALYAPEVWAGTDGFAARLDMLADLALGEGAVNPAASAASYRALLERLGGPSADLAAEPYLFNGLDAYYGNHCADAEYPRAFAPWRATDRYAAAGSRFGPLWWWSNAGCAAWPVNRDRYAGPWSTRTANPVLVVGNRFDPSTAYSGAQASARYLHGSRLLTYAGWGHTAFGRSECVTRAVVDYLIGGSLPEPGTECPANPNPFLPSDARSAGMPAPLVGLPPAWTLVVAAGR